MVKVPVLGMYCETSFNLLFLFLFFLFECALFGIKGFVVVVVECAPQILYAIQSVA
jgi:hypothetical protein